MDKKLKQTFQQRKSMNEQHIENMLIICHEANAK